MRKLSGTLRKAAVLIASLDEPTADSLLEQMPAEIGAKIRRAIVELEGLERGEQLGVVREFLVLSDCPRDEDSLSDDEGVELAPELKQKIQHPLAPHLEKPAVAVRPAGAPTSSPAPALGRFQFLQQATAAELAQLLHSEHPQVSAVVLTHVPPEKSAEVLRHLDAEIQVAILRRIADSRHVDSDVLQELEQQLQRRFVPYDAASLEQPGIRTVQAILAAVRDPDHLARLGQFELVDKRLFRQAGVPLARASRDEEVPATSAVEPRTRSIQRETASSPDAEDQSMRSTCLPISPERCDDTENTEPARMGVAEETSADEPRSGWARWSQKKRSRASELGLRLYVEEEEESQPAMKPRRVASGSRGDHGRPHWRFSDITRLDPRALARLIQAAAPPTLLVALAGAEPEFIHRIVTQLPVADARQLKQHLQQLDSLQPQEIERAQQQMAHLAAAMCARGLLEMPRHEAIAPAA